MWGSGLELLRKRRPITPDFSGLFRLACTPPSGFVCRGGARGAGRAGGSAAPRDYSTGLTGKLTSKK